MSQRYQGRIVRWLCAFAGHRKDLQDLLDKEITRSDREVAATLEGGPVLNTEWKCVDTYQYQTLDDDIHTAWMKQYGIPYLSGSSWIYEGPIKTWYILDTKPYKYNEQGYVTQSEYFLTVTIYKSFPVREDRKSDIEHPEVGLWLSDQSVTKHYVTDVWSVKDDRHPGRLRPTHRAAKCNADHGHAELFCHPCPGWIKGIVTREHPSRLPERTREIVLAAAAKHGLPIFYPTKKGWKKV